MEIEKLLVEEAMLLDLKATTKAAALGEMIAHLVRIGRVSDTAVFRQGILDREAQSTTGLGEGIALPHAKNKAVTQATIRFARSTHGVDYGALCCLYCDVVIQNKVYAC
jgi:PTS system fructose-specific IIC component